MKLYRYSPIKNERATLEALEYIQTGLAELSKMTLDERLPINTLKIFAHYDDEYDYLFRWINGIGEKDKESSTTSYYVKPYELTQINSESIEYIGLRVPDPYRPQVGCGDFVVDNFDFFAKKYLHKSKFVRQIPHQKYKMIELFHPDIDVLGYVVEAY